MENQQEMKKTKIDIRISESALKEIDIFLSRYKNESHSTLIQKSMRRFIRLHKSGFNSIIKGIEKGQCKIHAKVNSKTDLEFQEIVCKIGYFFDSNALRASIRYYMRTEPHTPLKDLDLLLDDIKQRPIIIEGE